MLIIFAIFTFLLVRSNEARIPDQDELIVFPNITNVRPLKENLKFLTAAKSVFNTATRLIQISRSEADDNWVVSPLGLAVMLGQLMLGSRGEFHDILGIILSPGNDTGIPPGLDVHRELGNLLNFLQRDSFADYLLFVNSALFVTPQTQLKESYKHALEDMYKTQLRVTNFTDSQQSMEDVNSWVNKSTLGFINALLTEPLPQTTASFFVNTVYFRGGWKTPFDVAFTQPRPFNISPEKQINTMFMVGDMEVLYLQDKQCNCTMVGIPYNNFDIMLYVFLPTKQSEGKRYDLNSFADQLSLERMTEMIRIAELENVTLAMPKLKLKSKLSLRAPIVQAIMNRRTEELSHYFLNPKTPDEEKFMNIASNSFIPEPNPLKIHNSTDPYEITFNMGSASDDIRFQVDDLVHSVELIINEEGTEAVAVTTTLVDYAANRFVSIDRPFLFMIRHEFTKANLFWGSVYNPE